MVSQWFQKKKKKLEIKIKTYNLNPGVPLFQTADFECTFAVDGSQ